MSIKKPRRPVIALSRLNEHSPQVYKKLLPRSKYASKYDKEKISNYLADPDTYLFNVHAKDKYYRSYHESDYRQDVNIYTENDCEEALELLKQHYDSFSEEQRYLAFLFVKPEVIIANDISTPLTANDYLPINPWYVSMFGVYQCSVVSPILKMLPNDYLHYVLADFPLEKFGYNNREKVTDFQSVLVKYLRKYPEQAVGCYGKYLPTIVQNRVDFYTMAMAIESTEVVPFFINAFVGKAGHESAVSYLKNYLPLCIDEVLIHFFNKADDAVAKKLQKNSQAIWHWLVENHQTETLERVTAYNEAQADNTLLDYTNNYLSWVSAKSDENKQAEKAITAESKVSADGVPLVLLNDDWQSMVKRRKINLPLDVSEFPPLVLQENYHPIPHDAFERLIKMLLISPVDKPLAILPDVLKFFTKQSQTQLADALWRDVGVTVTVKNDWLMTASVLLYDRHLGKKITDIVTRYTGGTLRRSIKLMFDVLTKQALFHNNDYGRNANKNALRALVHVMQNGRELFKKTAKDQLALYAKNTNTTIDELVDIVLPSLGLDLQGKRVFTNFDANNNDEKNGNESIVMRLDNQLRPYFLDEKNQKISELPSIFKTDANLEEMEYITETIQHFLDKDYQILENMLLGQRRISFERFQQYYLHQAFILRVSSQLIWAMYDNDKAEKISQAFSVVETGECLDTEGEPITMSNRQMIGLVHPVQLTLEELNYFNEYIEDEEIVQPFLQLNRPVYKVTEEEKKQRYITRYNGVHFTPNGFDTLIKNNWCLVEEYGGMFYSYDKFFGDKKRSISVESKNLGDWISMEEDQSIDNISISGLNLVEISEIIADIEAMKEVT